MGVAARAIRRAIWAALGVSVLGWTAPIGAAGAGIRLGQDLEVVAGVYGGRATHNRSVEMFATSTLRPGDPAGSMVINRDLVMHDGSTLELCVPANLLAPRIVVFGDVIIEEGAVLEVVTDGF